MKEWDNQREREREREWNKKNDPNPQERFFSTFVVICVIGDCSTAKPKLNGGCHRNLVAQSKLITLGCRRRRRRRKVFSSLSSVSHDSLVFGLLLLLLLLLLLGQTSKQTGKKSAGELSVTFRFVLITLRNRRERE